MSGRVALAALLCTACGTPPESDEAIGARLLFIHSVEHVRELAPEPVPEAVASTPVTTGSLDAKSLCAGDRLVYGIDSFAGESRTRYWLAFETVAPSDGTKQRVELVQPGLDDATRTRTFIDSAIAVVRVTLFDASGAVLASDDSPIEATVHELGLFAYARANGGPRATRMRTLDSRRARLPLFLRDPDWGHAILWRLFVAFGGNDALTGCVRRLDVWPGFFELPGLLFANLTLHGGLDQPRVVPQPIEGLPAGDDALEITVSLWHDGPLLATNLVLVPPVGPLAMTAGIVTATGYRPLEPDRRFVMRLIGVGRTGPGPG
ncbi:MAG: hypothetical protein HZB39_14520 [Planctomycetes bacterium]|nr:hypothetical protein [Planctomycetota bacterium]